MFASISLELRDSDFLPSTISEFIVRESKERRLFCCCNFALEILAVPRKLSILFPVKFKSRSPEKFNACFVNPKFFKSAFSTLACNLKPGFLSNRLSAPSKPDICRLGSLIEKWPMNNFFSKSPFTTRF